MALNIHTDKSFDEALSWLADKESKTKSDVIRELVLERFRNKRAGFRFGALASVIDTSCLTSETIQEELKSIDTDHELQP